MIDALCALGHIASLQSLTARGVTPGQLRRAAARGLVQRLRRGVYGCPHLGEQIIRAATIGGGLTCVSVLRAHGVWAGHCRRVHIQVPPTSSATPDPSARFHWALPRFGLQSAWMATRLQSLWQAVHCLDEENAQDGIRRMVGNSGSGNETIVRLRLERAGFTVAGPCARHGASGPRRRRLRRARCRRQGVAGGGGPLRHGPGPRCAGRERLGRHALRIRTAHIFETWPHTLAVVERAVADARQDRERRRGRVLVGYGDPM